MSALRHTDHHCDVKHREQVFARIRTDLMRESGNRASFDRVKSRILGDREVQRDSVLASMVRSFIAEREASFATMHPSTAQTTYAPTHQIARSFDEPIQTPDAARRAAQNRLGLLDQQFHEQITQFHEAEAELVHEKIIALCRENAGLASTDQLAKYDTTLNSLSQRREEFEKQIHGLTAKAIVAAKAGDDDTATRVVKRLSSMHALHRQLLPEDRFNEIREKIVHAGAERGQALAVRKVIDRERAVAAELKSLAATIHRFHKVSRSAPHDSAEYQKAERGCHQAVEDIRSHDGEWLAALILELLDLLAELHDPIPPKAQQQVDHFVSSVRSALSKLRKEAQVVLDGAS